METFSFESNANGGVNYRLVPVSSSYRVRHGIGLPEGQTSIVKIPPSMRHHSWDYLHWSELFINREGAMVGVGKNAGIRKINIQL
jgi:hypothetical protein